MPDPSGYELDLFSSESSPPPEAPRRSTHVWVAVAVLAAAALAAAYVAFVWWPHRPATTATTSSQPAAREPPISLGGQAEPIELPPLDASDGLVRTLVRGLSDSPAVAAWLTTNGLIRNFTVVVTNISDGATPARQLSVLRPKAPFRVVESGGTLHANPRDYERYTTIADAVRSVDAAGAAKLYATLKPRIEEANRELGSPDPSFDRTLERAIVTLLETPTLTGSEALIPKDKGIGYAFADERLEGLPAAQRQLLRMGPANVRIVKAKLREIAIALGIPPSRVPTR